MWLRSRFLLFTREIAVRLLLLLALFGFGFASAGRAVPITLWDNGTPAGSTSSNGGSPIAIGQFAGDDFLLNTAANLTGAQFHGFSTGSTPLTSLDYYLYNWASSGLPGSLVQHGSVSNLTTTPDGLLAGYLASFNFGAPLNLDPGHYFLVLGNANFFDFGWGSTTQIHPGTSPSIAQLTLSSTPSSLFSSGNSGYDLAFTLLGTPVAPTPEPSSAVLAGSMLVAGVVLLRRKRLSAQL